MSETCDRCKYPEPVDHACHACPKCNRPARTCVIITEEDIKPKRYGIYAYAVYGYPIIDRRRDSDWFIGVNI